MLYVVVYAVIELISFHSTFNDYFYILWNELRLPIEICIENIENIAALNIKTLKLCWGNPSRS